MLFLNTSIKFTKKISNKSIINNVNNNIVTLFKLQINKVKFNNLPYFGVEMLKCNLKLLKLTRFILKKVLKKNL